MKALMQYRDINHTLAMLKKQAIESIPFAKKVCPKFYHPEQLFNWLKENTTFVSDPKGRELLQTMPTLWTGRRTGIKGGGDCDCFVITSLACFARQCWTDVDVVLAGRNKRNPVHIYTKIKWNGKWYTFDVTNPQFDYERDGYKYFQYIPALFLKQFC